MTSKERIVAALTGEPVDRLPFCPFLAYVWEFFSAEIQEAGHLAFHHAIGADPLWRGAPCPTRFIEPAGVAHEEFPEDGKIVHLIRTPVGDLRYAVAASTEGNTHFLVEHRLKSEDDFKIQAWIEEHRRIEGNPEAVAAHFAGEGREGLSLGMLVPRMKSAFQTLVEEYVGTEELAYAMSDFPETVDMLWRTMVERDMEAAAMAVDSPYDYFITWEDSSTQNYTPVTYDRCIGSEIARWCNILAPARKHYIQHACGHLRALLGTMRNTGILAVESLSPHPTGNITLAEARAIGGSRLGIIGGIEPTEFLRLPLNRLGDYVEQVIADGQGGPFVLANSDSCPPGVTVEKFKRVAEVARAWQP